MSDLALKALLEFLLWWGFLSAGYCAAVLAVDWLITSWRQRRDTRRSVQTRMLQLNAEMASSVARLSAAFVTAQKDIRETSRREVRRR